MAYPFAEELQDIREEEIALSKKEAELRSRWAEKVIWPIMPLLDWKATELVEAGETSFYMTVEAPLMAETGVRGFIQNKTSLTISNLPWLFVIKQDSIYQAPRLVVRLTDEDMPLFCEDIKGRPDMRDLGKKIVEELKEAGKRADAMMAFMGGTLEE